MKCQKVAIKKFIITTFVNVVLDSSREFVQHQETNLQKNVIQNTDPFLLASVSRRLAKGLDLEEISDIP